jgi:hypothetical protein
LTRAAERVELVHAPWLGNAAAAAVQLVADLASGLCEYGFTIAGMLPTQRQAPLFHETVLGAAAIGLRVPVHSREMSVFSGRSNRTGSRKDCSGS